MRRRKLRSQREVVERCSSLRQDVEEAAQRDDPGDRAAVDALWRAEALGTLLWALSLAALPPYDRPFELEALLTVDTSGGSLREPDELELELDAVRLWHWRARTADLEEADTSELPDRYASLEQLVAATAMRGYDASLLPQPLRGDFPAFGKVYRHLSAEQRAVAHSIALERHRALAWLCGASGALDEEPLDT